MMTLKARQGLTAIGLLLLIAAGVAGLYLTARPASRIAASQATAALSGESLSLDPRYLQTALQIAVLASTPSERHQARNALNAADDELDLQYAYALQRAAITPVPETPRIRALQARIGRIDKAMQARRAQVDRLKALVPQLHGARKGALQQQLEVSQAELGLFRERLDDANDALEQAGGSLQGRLAKLKAQHAALSQEHDAFKFPAVGAAPLSGSLLSKWSRWRAIDRRQHEILQAQQAVDADVESLTSQQNSLGKRIATAQAQSKARTTPPGPPPQPAPPPRRSSAPLQQRSPGPARGAPPALLAQSNVPGSLIASIQRLAAHRVMLRIIGRRIQAMNALSSAYVRWGALVARASRTALHSLIAGCLWIVLLLTGAFFLNRFIEHLFAGLSLERRQKATLQAVLRICVQLVAALAILMIIFGTPHNLSTVLGLAGAGLAIALQSFILSFLGWFVLMGRDGIRVGDFIEINPNSFSGVRGEVIEISLFRTVLLEAGDWNESGHLTGRQVALMNMYAVTGYYFNFSTSGQWLWDELEVAIPRTEDPYPVVARIRALVASATEQETREAEREWKHVSTRYGTRSFSAQPAVTIRATDTGVLAVIRYITRADERSAMRSRLSQGIIKLFHHGEELVAEPEALPDAEAAASASHP